MATAEDINILHVPEEIPTLILSYLTFEDLSNCRLVCKTFDKLCQKLLNLGFAKVDKYHGRIQREVKAKLPRRESERRNHVLARHVDILGSIETRLSLLSMTYMKYIEASQCCFIPGKVIDEMYRVLRFVKHNDNPPSTHELLRELRDITSMAMEHFDEKMVPRMKKVAAFGFHRSSWPGFPIPGYPNLERTVAVSGLRGVRSCSNTSETPDQQTNLRPVVLQTKTMLNSTRGKVLALRKMFLDYRTKNRSCTELVKKLTKEKAKIRQRNKSLREQLQKSVEQEKQLLEQSKMITDLSSKVMAQEKLLTELNRKVIESQQILARINQGGCVTNTGQTPPAVSQSSVVCSKSLTITEQCPQEDYCYKLRKRKVFSSPSSGDPKQRKEFNRAGKRRRKT